MRREMRRVALQALLGLGGLYVFLTACASTGTPTPTPVPAGGGATESTTATLAAVATAAQRVAGATKTAQAIKTAQAATADYKRHHPNITGTIVIEAKPTAPPAPTDTPCRHGCIGTSKPPLTSPTHKELATVRNIEVQVTLRNGRAYLQLVGSGQSQPASAITLPDQATSYVLQGSSDTPVLWTLEMFEPSGWIGRGSIVSYSVQYVDP